MINYMKLIYPLEKSGYSCLKLTFLHLLSLQILKNMV